MIVEPSISSAFACLRQLGGSVRSGKGGFVRHRRDSCHRNCVLFAERTGWLKGDDGFLVLDGNGNGRVDGIGEMFGGRAGGGFAELAANDNFDDAHDAREVA